MNPADRAAFSISKLILLNKYGRYFLVTYSLALHMLILMVIYRTAMSEEQREEIN